MHSVKKVFVLVTVFLVNYQLAAQARLTVEQSFYDQVHAERVAKDKDDFNLKGKVRQVTGIDGVTRDTTVLVFNAGGLLTRHWQSRPKSLTTYVFEAGVLQQLVYRIPGFTSSRQFENGYLVKETTETTGFDPFGQEAFYTYDQQAQTLEIRYMSNLDTITDMDRVIHDSYTFTVNRHNQVTRERHLSRHEETMYGTRSTYVYDSITGNLLQLHCMDDCAEYGSNSCLNLHFTFGYDAQNRLVLKSLDDQTVRNSFSRGYTMSAKYNEHGDVIEFSQTTDDDQRVQILLHAENKWPKTPAPAPPRPFFDYTYDANGNWIEKYEVLQGVRKRIATRIIDYAD